VISTPILPTSPVKAQSLKPFVLNKALTKCKSRALALSQMRVILALGQSGVSTFALIRQKIKEKCPLSKPISNQ